MILGCKDDTSPIDSKDNSQEILMHWIATHSSLWNMLIMEKNVKYEAKDNLAIVYARDLEILLFAEYYYHNKLIEIYGYKNANDSTFLKEKWEELIIQLTNEDITLLDYNKEWNSYRFLFYSTKPNQRGDLYTRSEGITIWGCGFRTIVYEGLKQLSLNDFDKDKIVNGLFHAEPMDFIFAPIIVSACEQPYYEAVKCINDMKKNNGSLYNGAACYGFQQNLKIIISKLTKCIQDKAVALKDEPLPPGEYYPSLVIGSISGTENFNNIKIECSNISEQNSHIATGIYNHILEETSVEIRIYDYWKQYYPNKEVGTFITVENNKYGMIEVAVGDEHSCPLKNRKDYVAVIHTHPKGLIV